MARECNIGIIIDGGSEINLKSLGFHLIESPNILSPSLRAYESSKNPETNGISIFRRTVNQPFDYDLKLAYIGDIDSANSAIKELYDKFFEYNPETGLTSIKSVEVRNYYKRTMVVGLPKSYDGSASYYDNVKDIVLFSFGVRVSDTNNTDFDYSEHGTGIGYWAIGVDFEVS